MICYQEKTVRAGYMHLPQAVLIKIMQKCCARSGWNCQQLVGPCRGRIEGVLYNIVASRAESRAFALKHCSKQVALQAPQRIACARCRDPSILS